MAVLGVTMTHITKFLSLLFPVRPLLTERMRRVRLRKVEEGSKGPSRSEGPLEGTSKEKGVTL